MYKSCLSLGRASASTKATTSTTAEAAAGLIAATGGGTLTARAVAIAVTTLAAGAILAGGTSAGGGEGLLLQRGRDNLSGEVEEIAEVGDTLIREDPASKVRKALGDRGKTHQK